MMLATRVKCQETPGPVPLNMGYACFLILRDGRLHTSMYDKRDDSNFHIINFPSLSSNIPTSPAFGVFISQLTAYTIIPGLLLLWMFYSEATFK